MSEPQSDEIEQHLFLVGAVCSGWSYLEFLMELAFWWLTDFLHRRKEGRVLTASLSLEVTAKKVCELYHLKISDPIDRKAFNIVRNRILAILDERNLAVHGVRQLDPSNNETRAEIARGKYKNIPQNLSIVRLNSLISEIFSIVGALEPLLVKYRVLESPGNFLGPPQFPRRGPEGS